jgi:hypothetical protein
MGRRQGARRARILKRYVTDEQRSRRPIFIATLRAAAVGCFSALLAPYVSSPDTLVARDLKNSQLTGGETYTYFGDRTLETNFRNKKEALVRCKLGAEFPRIHTQLFETR